MTRYRIVKDTYLGYEVQYKRWWWSPWTQVPHNFGLVNTWRSVEDAEIFARICMNPVVKEVLP